MNWQQKQVIVSWKNIPSINLEKKTGNAVVSEGQHFSKSIHMFYSRRIVKSKKADINSNLQYILLV